MTSPNDQIPEWRIREIAREASEMAAQRAIEMFCQRLGIENLPNTRRNLDFLAAQSEAAMGRRNEGRKTVFTVIASIAMAVVGYIVAALNLKGHVP